jgi:UDP-2,4-diacetamido-2,4,6-trideoxy-beta-L-altropyranose hydrolase
VRGSLLIRADAGTQIGTGHLMRCLALAQAWRAGGGRAVFLVGQGASLLAGRPGAEEFSARPLDAPAGSREDAGRTAEAAAAERSHAVVVDGYAFGADYQRRLKDAGLRLLFVDDHGHAGEYCADLVLNQNIDAAPGPYAKRAAHTRLLLGTRYALLRREFRTHGAWRRAIAPRVRRILVTLGGGDPDNVTLTVIRALRLLDDPALEAVVVAGGANPHLRALEEAARGARFPIRLVRDVPEMPALMTWADLAVSAGGTTCWEMACLGLPHLVLVLADHQKAIAAGLDRAGSVVSLGEARSCSAEEIAGRLRSLGEDARARDAMSRRGRELVDGQGALRVARELDNLA